MTVAYIGLVCACVLVCIVLARRRQKLERAEAQTGV